MPMSNKPQLKPFDVSHIEVFSNDRDLRRDLHIFVDYVCSRDVKRKYGDNELSKSDSKRLAKLFGDPELVQAVQETGGAVWIDFVDQVALHMGFVKYQIAGKYNYGSGFHDNYIDFQEDRYNHFLSLSPIEQESELRETLVSPYKDDNNEFFRISPLGRSSAFTSWGSGRGVMSTLNFAKIRNFLLNLLSKCETGVWYCTKSLVKYLKTQKPYFLIPEKTVVTYHYPTRKEVAKRYGNFHEGGSYNYDREPIPDDANDGFERVEGRYIERFLEYIPLVLGYVDVAYREPRTNEYKPTRGMIQAFRVNERLIRAMTGDVLPARVTIQPNFEVFIDATFYPVNIIQQLSPLANVIKSDTVTIMQLEKRKVAATLAENTSLDVVALLRELAENELPQNIVIELEEWAGHADVFTLYNGFSLIEGASKIESVKRSTIETINSNMVLVNERDTQLLLRQLQKKQHIPLRFRHNDDAFWILPDGIQTVLLTESDIKVEPETVNIKIETHITLRFPNTPAFDAVLKGLLDARCPVVVDNGERTLTLPRQYKEQVNQVIYDLRETYLITAEEM
jgi:hypothetical protein